jgi:hypothetical protein
LACAILHLANVASLRVLIGSQQAKRENAFELDWYVGMQRLPLGCDAAIC